jgi:hypothetical protein
VRARSFLLAVLAAASLGLASRVLAQTPDEVARGREAYAEAVAAWRAGDRPRFLASIERADALRPAHPGILYALASAQAMNGDAPRAVATLGRLADMGLAYDPTGDEDFAGLAADPAFAEVAARLEANGGPVGVADTAFTLPWRDFVPEGLARDPRSGDVFVSGVHARRVVRVRGDGRAEPFVDGLWSALGLAVDAERRILWIGTAAMPETAGADSSELGRGSVVGVDLDSGRRVAELPLPDDGRAHVPGDLSLAPDGTLFVADGAAGILWVRRPGATALEVLTGADRLVSPQGSALSADGRTLWLADYSLGLLAVDPATGAARALSQPENAALLGIDALLRQGNDLIAVQNGVRPARVLRIRLDGERVIGWEPIAASLPAFEEPTGAFIHADTLWLVANSHWDRFEEGRLLDPASLSPPLVVTLPLRPCERC